MKMWNDLFEFHLVVCSRVCSNVNVSHQPFIVRKLLIVWRSSTLGGNWRVPSSPQCWQPETFQVKHIFWHFSQHISHLQSHLNQFEQAKVSSPKPKNRLTKRPRNLQTLQTTSKRMTAFDWDDKKSSKLPSSWSKLSTEAILLDTREFISVYYMKSIFL